MEGLIHRLGTAPATACIAAMCVAVFLLQHVGGFDPAAWPGCEWWRYVAANFGHGGILHLACNMWVLMWIGTVVEQRYGSLRAAAAFIVGGIVGTAVAVGVGTSVLGASAGVWALVTYALVREIMEKGAGSGFANDLYGVVVANLFASFIPGVSLVGHLGGGLAGVAIGVVDGLASRRR